MTDLLNLIRFCESLSRPCSTSSGFGEPPDLIRRQLQDAQHSAERLASVDAAQELLPQFGW